jgi:hypothetical protein
LVLSTFIQVQLPPTVGQMGSSLKTVDMNRCPKLTCLPGSIARWRLDHLAVPVSTLVPAFEIAAADPTRSILSDTLSTVPSLLDLCCIKVSSKIGRLSEEDVPLSLLEKLETMQKCFCLNFVHRLIPFTPMENINDFMMVKKYDNDQLCSG